EVAAAPRRKISATDEAILWRRISETSNRAQIWLAGHAGPSRQFDRAAPWTASVSLLRSMPAWLLHRFLLQQSLCNSARCGTDGKVHACKRRRCQPSVDWQ